MKNLFQLIHAALMKEPRHRYRSYRITWRKVMCSVAVIATFGVVLQTCVLPSPMNHWILSPTIRVSPYESPKSAFHVKETLPMETLEHFSSVLSNISSNGTREIIPPVPAVEARAEVSPSMGREHMNNTNKNLNAATVLPQPTQMLNVTSKIVPPVEVRAEVSHSTGKEHMNTTNKNLDAPRVLPPPTPVLSVPHQVHIWSLPPDEALAYAKRELERSPIVVDDPDLYAPLFRNVSIFKRSYEFMESILKVYIYKDGARPIFHTPHLKGIYASEGWFMKLMEGNRQFVTSDPKKAHLFYLPYSARQLEKALYVPDSHNIKPLSIFLRNYVNMISAKYPFWNRTRGADHFLVACHDWGPYTVSEHKELRRNTIKALCNADVSEGIFLPGRDVSLPETTIRRPRKPLRGIGGKRVSQRPILAFFAGNMHGRVRPALVQHWRGKDEDMKIYGPLPNRVAKVMSYAVHMKSSKYCICPMGFEVNSPRIVEAIYNECVPVIIADNFVLPFDEVLDWKAFSVVVAEKDIPKLKEILVAIPLRRYLWMQTNVKMLQKHFLWNPIPIKYDLFHMVLHSIWFNRLNQIQI